jgi:hypothetical protein
MLTGNRSRAEMWPEGRTNVFPRQERHFSDSVGNHSQTKNAHPGVCVTIYTLECEKGLSYLAIPCCLTPTITLFLLEDFWPSPVCPSDKCIYKKMSILRTPTNEIIKTTNKQVKH